MSMVGIALLLVLKGLSRFDDVVETVCIDELLWKCVLVRA